jgi:signal transduction histidine kinase
MRAWWSRLPRDTRVAAALAILVLFQTVALAAFGLAAARSQRAETEQALRTLGALSLSRGLAEPAAEALARAGAAVADACARGTATEAAAVPLQPPLFGRGFALLPDGSVVDGAGHVVVAPRPPAGPEDAALRARLASLEAAAEWEGKGAEAARAALEAEEGTADPVAGARALRLAARAALRAGEDALALRAAERLLQRWPDADAGGGYPFGAGAAAAACEVWRRRLAAGAPGAVEGFAEAILARRRVLLRAPFPPSVAAAEADEVRRDVEGAREAFPPGRREALEEALAALEEADRGADLVRPPALRAALLEAASGGRPRWVTAPGLDGSPHTFCAAPAGGGAVCAFPTDAPRLRAAVLAPLLRTLAPREGVAVRLLSPDRRPLDRGEAPPPGAVLASLEIPLPTGPVLAEAVLADPALLDSEAARARNLLLGTFAAAALALGLGSLLVLRMVRAEVRLAKMKAEFVSAVSHDLKTPLTSIRMFVETLREGRARTEGERRECLEVVDREASRLERIIHRVLDFSRLASGARKVVREPCDPGAVAREAAQVFRGRISGEPCDFRVEAGEGLAAAPMDRDAVTQVLLDLLENARKFTPPASRSIVLRASGGARGGARFEVEDNGPGIPEAERERVFEEFYRVDRPGVEGADGTGLGLALVRRLVAAHRGEVRIEDAPGGGSRFVVEIPGASRG